SILNSRLNFRLCMTHLWLDKTPNLGVHQTGSSSESGAEANANVAQSKTNCCVRDVGHSLARMHLC
ncbi:hypothetical protein, partial [Bradyrhizobium sp. 30]|uniref:hypothetical protein n=1 Tax=Bradyrhizobium sp. 30 TaxID=2782669 RepID=UPI001FFC03B5